MFERLTFRTFGWTCNLLGTDMPSRFNNPYPGLESLQRDRLPAEQGQLGLDGVGVRGGHGDFSPFRRTPARSALRMIR